MPTPVIPVYGIRHHGPGSARSLLAALAETPPDLILIEGPPDADALLPRVADAGMQPPVALLVYNPKNLRQASFFPFADFSPEWQAILFGLRRGIPVRFMDLPMRLAFALQPEAEEAVQLTLEGLENRAPTASDPFTDIARLAGYSDPERWWEATFERTAGAGGPDVFALVLDLMRALRESKAQGGFDEPAETLLREAHMRQTIRQAQKEGFQHIAVVCGAWHAPALADTPNIKAASDTAHIQGLKKINTLATWIPWSFDRLASQSGYGAGVGAPAWYQELWNTPAVPGTPHARWLSRAARLLRDNDIALSPAHVLEAVRLAETLAALRNTLLPGIEELCEAAISVLCEGAEKPFELIERHLVIGDVLGAVPDTVPAVPLKADFEEQLRKNRLKISTEAQSLALDLREGAHLRKSQFLHRLLLLQIPWAKTEAVEGRKEGGFHENWTLKWLPDYEIRLIEAGAWGNTVAEAATRRARHRTRQTEQLPELVRLLESALKAGLTPAMPAIFEKLQQMSALAHDAPALADAVLPLVEVLRYGHARQMDLPAIGRLLEQIVPRVCIQLPGSCRGINEDVAADMLKRILAVHRALHLWRPERLTSLWVSALEDIAGQAAPLLAGLAARLLFEQKSWAPGETALAMQFRLSHAQPPVEAAQWLDGFLHGSGLLLIHQPALWQLVQQWVDGLAEPGFPELLPLLRRTFSRFSGPEREKMLDLARQGGGRQAALAGEPEDWDAARAELVRPILDMVLSGNQKL
ncbi:MAG: hypothetical protein IPM81_10790 [Saprospirales bacterium]|nr:hypothetical protein [Saprospirales bacterium]